MNIYEEEIYFQLKGIFFDLLTVDNEALISDNLANQVMTSLKTVMKWKNVTFYLYHQWSDYYIPEASTIEFVKKQPELFIVSGKLIDKEILLSKQICHYSFITETENSKTYLVSLYQKNDLVGFLQFDASDEQLQYSNELLHRIGKDFLSFMNKVKSFSKHLTDDYRYEKLFSITAKFHSSMKMEDVLKGLIEILQKILPEFTYYLLLSHDNSYQLNLPIKILQYDDDPTNMAALQSYVTGTVQIEDLIDDKKSILYAPLKGKQGIYGVLQVIRPLHTLFLDDEINFISLLANTAGSALENAQLYQQSKQLIQDLRLINETSCQLNSILRLNEVGNFVSNQILSSFKADEVGFITFSKAEMKTLSGSTPYFFTDQVKHYLEIIKSKIVTKKDSLFIGDILSDDQLKELTYRSLMAVPMVQDGNIKGVAVVLHRDAYYFSFDSFKLLQSLIHHTTLAFSNSMLREKLENLVITDYLTNLYSRNYLDEKIQLSMKHDQFGSLILIDIDDFKQINDKFGHQVGDKTLILVSQIIKANIRDKDIGARWGGEELAIYLPKVDLELAKQIAERLTVKVQEESNPKVTISCGVSCWRADQKESMCNLFKRADEALYLAKNAGKNQVVTNKMYLN